MRIGTTTVAGTLLLLLASEGGAQEQARQWRDSSAQRVLREFRASRGSANGAWWVTELLRGGENQIRGAQRDGLADSLTQIAVSGSTSPGGSEEQRMAMRALSTVAQAGMAEDRSGLPYAGALDRLIQIHKSAAGLVRNLSLDYMTAVPGRERALAYLRSTATDTGETATWAITSLINESLYGGRAKHPPALREAATNTLKELFRSDAVRAPEARSFLDSHARSQGWQR